MIHEKFGTALGMLLSFINDKVLQKEITFSPARLKFRDWRGARLFVSQFTSWSVIITLTF